MKQITGKIIEVDGNFVKIQNDGGALFGFFSDIRNLEIGDDITIKFEKYVLSNLPLMSGAIVVR